MTGVQTCALPICERQLSLLPGAGRKHEYAFVAGVVDIDGAARRRRKRQELFLFGHGWRSCQTCGQQKADRFRSALLTIVFPDFGLFHAADECLKHAPAHMVVASKAILY